MRYIWVLRLQPVRDSSHDLTLNHQALTHQVDKLCGKHEDSLPNSLISRVQSYSSTVTFHHEDSLEIPSSFFFFFFPQLHFLAFTMIPKKVLCCLPLAGLSFGLCSFHCRTVEVCSARRTTCPLPVPMTTVSFHALHAVCHHYCILFRLFDLPFHSTLI